LGGYGPCYLRGNKRKEERKRESVKEKGSRGKIRERFKLKR
jgi:hypothetical protein